MSGQGPTLQDRLEFFALVLLLGILQRLPLGTSRSLGRGLGSLVASVGLRRKVALENLHLAFPDWNETECLKVYRGMCRMMGITLADFSKLKAWTGDEVAQQMRFVDRGPLEVVASGGQGGIFLSGHYGNWELQCAASSAVSGEVAAMGGRQRNPLVEKLINDYRRAGGVTALTVRDGLRESVKHLKQGGLIATLADQDGGEKGVFDVFLGKPASVRPGVFRLAARLNLPVVVGFSVWKGDYWQTKLYPPIVPEAFQGDEEAVVLQLIQAFNRKLEAAVREHPDHWFWVHRRWKSQPKIMS
jgi:KDO2-lipid IV(A) lauroyltransferase